MQSVGYGWRRARARAGLVALLTGMSALIVLALAGTVGYLDVASTAGVRDAIASSPATARTQVVQTRLADDAAAQQTGADAVIADLLPGATTWSTIRTPPIPISGTDAGLVLLVDDGAAAAAQLTDGSWPSAAGETALHAAAAQALGLTVGDTVEITASEEATELTVVGLWQPDDADDSRWAGDLSVSTGVDPSSVDGYGPALVTADTLTPLSVVPFVRWVIAPGTELSPDTLDRWVDALPRVEPALDDAGLTVRGMVTSGTLITTLTDARASLASVRASSTIPLVIVALVSLVGLWQITQLLAALRERETLVLLSRGASPRQIVGFGALEATGVACGALLGGAVVVAALRSRPGLELGGILGVTAGVALAVLLVMVAAVVRAAVTGLHPAGESGRARAALTGSLLVLVVGLAAFTLWRFSRNGTPLLPGTQRVDVVAVAGPALALIAVALVAVALAGPALRGLASLSARRTGFSPVTELRQSSRRISVNAVPVVLVVLATSVATLASGYAGTWQGLRTTSAQVSVGADARVDTTGGIVGSQPRGVAEAAATAGATSATGVLQTSMVLDDLGGQVTALDMSAAATSSAPADVLDPAVAALTPTADPLPGLDLPADSGELSLTVTASARGQVDDIDTRRTLQMRVWLSSGSELVVRDIGGPLRVVASGTYRFTDEGELVEQPNPAAGRPVTTEVTTELPAGTWRVVAVDTVMQTSVFPTAWDVSVDALTVDGTDVMPTQAWPPDVLRAPGQSESYLPQGTMGFTGTFTGDVVGQASALVTLAVQRWMPDNETPTSVPVVVTGPWADLVRPDGTAVQVSATVLELQQVGTIPVVPGNPDPRAVLADLRTLQNAYLRAADDVPAITQIWVDGDGSPADLADALRVTFGPQREVVATGDGVTDAVAAPARIVYWVAAVCALLLALPAIVAVAMTQAASRRGEVVVLRAVGVSPRRQGRSRTRELASLELGAVVAGVAAGAALNALVMVSLIRSTTPQVSRAVPLGLTYDWLPGAALVGVTVGTLVVVALWYGARVRSQARDTSWREEIR